MQEVAPGTVVPLFPLPDFVLFPGIVQPLHIFEPRYRQMTTEALDSIGCIVMGTVLDEHHKELPGDSATVQPLAGLARIQEYERLEDGRYLLVVRGLARVEFEEATSDRLYRKVSVTPITEASLAPDREDSLHRRVGEAVLARASDQSSIPASVSLSQLVDLLLVLVKPDVRTLYGAFAETSIEERAELALNLHEQADG